MFVIEFMVVELLKLAVINMDYDHFSQCSIKNNICLDSPVLENQNLYRQLMEKGLSLEW